MANSYFTASPGISLSRKRKEIFIFRSTIEALGYPCFIRFLLNLEDGCLAVQGCEEKAQETFLVPRFNTPEDCFRIYSDDLTRVIWQKLRWEKPLTYRCFGMTFPEENLVEFNLNQAELVSEKTFSATQGEQQ